MRKALLVTVLIITSALSQASAWPQKASQQTLNDRLKIVQAKVDKMIAGHDQLMARLHQIEANLDAFQKQLAALRDKLNGK